MNQQETGMVGMRPLILGILLGCMGIGIVILCLPPRTERPVERPPAPRQPAIEDENHWPPPEYLDHCDWQYLRIDTNGWSTGPVGTYQDLDERLAHASTSGTEMVIPIFPTVYRPDICDKLYYDAILESDIEPGDKVLVIGTGSGADAWVASLKSQDLVYVVEVNPMAVANARATARLGNFRIRPITGDITEVDLPGDFGEFDFVLWNMPFFEHEGRLKHHGFHDGDNGRILRGFLTRLPSLLKDDGTAILLNDTAAGSVVDYPGLTTRVDKEFMLFVIPKPAPGP